MKTTLELPDSLITQVKLRALKDGRKLQDEVADLLRKGLAAATEEDSDVPSAVLTTDEKTGLPLIECKHAAVPQAELTPQRVAEILMTQEVGWHHDAGR